RTRVYRPESLVWLEGYQALLRWRKEHEITGLHAVPYDTETEVGVTRAFPLGRWVHQQRKARRAGELEERRKKLLDAPEAGMVWEPGEEAWEAKLAVLRSYHRAHGHMAPRQDALWDDPADGKPVPIGQLLANLRRKGGLGKNSERSQTRGAQLSGIDPDWNCPWPLDWQRCYCHLAHLAADEPGGVVPDIAPGVLYEGDDLGKWLQRQRRSWVELSEGQQQRLTALGVQPAETLATAPAPKGATKGRPTKAQHAFQRGLAALAQYIQREGRTVVGRAHIEELPDGSAIKLGVFLSNQKARRDRLDATQRAALAELGYTWAAEQSGCS
ncbi:helicase associated domain-containing protein, partial [Nocardia sp. NPDC003354]